MVLSRSGQVWHTYRCRVVVPGPSHMALLDKYRGGPRKGVEMVETIREGWEAQRRFQRSFPAAS